MNRPSALFTADCMNDLALAARRFRVVRKNGTQIPEHDPRHARAVALALPGFPAFRVPVALDDEPLDVLEDL